MNQNYPTNNTSSSVRVFGGQFMKYTFVNVDVDGSNLVLSESVINELVDQFWSEVMSQVGDHVVMIQVQVKSQDKFYSISKLQTVNTEVKDSLKSLLILNLNLLYSKYSEYPIDELFIKWKVLDKSNPLAEVKLQKTSVDVNQFSSLTKYNLPRTMNLRKWEYELLSMGYELIHSQRYIQIYYNSHTKTKIIVNIQKKGKVHIVNYMSGSATILSFTDILIKKSKNHESFTRTLANGNVVNYVNGEQVNLTHSLTDVPFIKPLSHDNTLSNNFIVLDLETRKLSTGDLEVVSGVFYNGTEYYTYFLTDYESSKSMLTQMISDLFLIAAKGKATPVYVHNFSGFDSLFLLGILSDYSSKFNIVKREDKIISLIVTKDWSNNLQTSIVFKDSMLLLPASLEKLAVAFNVSLKGSFNFHKLNNSTDLNLIRDELLAYNKLDCLSLYQVILKFSEYMFDLFKLDIHKSSTLASLAFKLYRSRFMPLHAQIPITDVKLYDLIRSGYTGGHVDVYKPIVPHNKLVHCYDVNSLYPAVMATNDYPVGVPRYFEGSIDLQDKNTFGFLRVKVTAPEGLNIPLLLVRRHGKTIAPLGSWIDWYFTEELRLAVTLGYKIEILQGVLFDRGQNIFQNYVETLFNMRTTFTKSDPRNLICKLLLNSLYGRFGMSPRMDIYHLVDKSKELTMLPSDLQVVSDTKQLISMETVFNVQLSNPKAYFLDISLPIAMATTSYARIAMYKYKQLLVSDLLYTDTDSIMTTQKLPDLMVGKDLGLMKLEYTGVDAVFLAPKVYAVALADGYKDIKDATLGGYLFKIKGAKNHGLTLHNFMQLLYKDSSLKLAQERMFKNIEQNTINVMDTLYTLKVTDNKRTLLYMDGKFVDTKPFVIQDDKIVSDRVVDNFTQLSLVKYDPNASALVPYSLFCYPEYSPRFVYRYWRRLDQINFHRLTLHPSSFFMDSIWMRYPYALSDFYYYTHMFYFIRRYYLLLYFVNRILNS